MKNVFVCFVFAMAALNLYAQSDDSQRLDSMKRVIQARYDEISVKMNGRNIDTIMSYRTKDFRVFGPSGVISDYPMTVENVRYFVTNNIPPYLGGNTVQRIRVSPNKLILVADVYQETIRKRELAGKLRDVKVIVEQTETWVNQDGQWFVQSVENIHGRKRYVDGKRVSDDPNAPYDPNAPEYIDPSERKQNADDPISRNWKAKLSAKDLAVVKVLEKQFDKMTTAFAKDDMLAVSAVYADDARIAGGRFDVAGRKSIDDYWLGLKGKGRSWQLITNYIEVYGDLAIHDGISVLVSDYNGKDMESKSRFLVVWKKQKDGSWQISKDYYSFY